MIGDVNLVAILVAALAASMSPGPATLAVAGTSMARGRHAGLLLATGIVLGSLTWSISAALGLGALMLIHGWVFEIIRYAGAGYLLFLAWKSARSALSQQALEPKTVEGRPSTLIARGAALHIANPKAVLFFGALFSIGVPTNASVFQLATVVAAVGIQSALVFTGYAVLFSAPKMVELYVRLRRWFEGGFAVGFAAAGLKVATTRLQ